MNIINILISPTAMGDQPYSGIRLLCKNVKPASADAVDKIRELSRGTRLIQAEPDESKKKELIKFLYKMEKEGLLVLPSQVNNEPWTNIETSYLRLYHEGDPTLESCIREFTELNSDYADSESARSKCVVAAIDFISLLQERGVVTEEDIRSERIKKKRADFGETEHNWVEMDGVAYDFTARQFSRDIPFPYIYNVEADIPPWNYDEFKEKRLEIGGMVKK
jgi:hypothetical protein